MSEPAGEGKRQRRPRPGGGKRGGRPRDSRGSQGPGNAAGARRPPGAIGLYRLERGDFELVHPRKVEETREDYEEGMELWKEGDAESARDALRYALSACHENLWVHVALGGSLWPNFAIRPWHEVISDMHSSSVSARTA